MGGWWVHVRERASTRAVCPCLPPPAPSPTHPAPAHPAPPHPPPQTKGLVNAAGLALLDFGPKEPQEVWSVEDIHNKQPGLCLSAAASSKGGYGVVVSSSTKTDLRVFSASTGRQLGAMDTGGLRNHYATVSRDGRWVAAATFTSDVRVWEIGFDRTGAFSGVAPAMSLGHKSKVGGWVGWRVGESGACLAWGQRQELMECMQFTA